MAQWCGVNTVSTHIFHSASATCGSRLKSPPRQTIAKIAKRDVFNLVVRLFSCWFPKSKPFELNPLAVLKVSVLSMYLELSVSHRVFDLCVHGAGPMRHRLTAHRHRHTFCPYCVQSHSQIGSNLIRAIFSGKDDRSSYAPCIQKYKRAIKVSNWFV